MKLSSIGLQAGENVLAMPTLLLLSAWVCIVPSAGVVVRSGLHRAGDSSKAGLAGVRECLGLTAGEDMEVQSMKQRYGKDTFLVARPAGSPKPVAKAALHATFESLFRGSGCHADTTRPAAWLVNVGADDDEVLALASSVACGVFALDPKVDDVRAVEMTRCMNEEPFRPFAVFQMIATDKSDPSAINDILSQDGSQSYHRNHVSFVGERKPTMLNGVKEIAEDDHTEHLQHRVLTAATTSAKKALSSDAKLNVTAVVPSSLRGVSLDGLFMRPNASGLVSVMDSEGMSFAVDKIAVLKITPRSEGDAPLKALRGAQQMLENGRVKCLVTEMNFDLNTTEELISLFTKLEHVGFHFAHLGSLDYSELEITDSGSYPAFLTDSKQLQELFDTYRRIRSFDERSGFRVYSGSLSLDRNGNYFDYSDLIFACREGFPSKFAVEAKGNIRFKNGVWWIEKR